MDVAMSRRLLWVSSCSTTTNKRGRCVERVYANCPSMARSRERSQQPVGEGLCAESSLRRRVPLQSFGGLAAFGRRTPMIDRFEIEAPVTTDLEGRNPPLLEQAIDGGRMDSEIVRDLFQRKYVRHSTSSNNF